MSLGALITAGEILNRAAAEVGVAPVVDPYSSSDPVFVQMRYLLNTAGEELLQLYQWELLVREHQIITALGDTGVYDLPADFDHMINQTGWERSQRTPMGGPLSAQDWNYLKGRNASDTLFYANFRIAEGKFNIYPENPPAGLDINFEYVTLNWVKDGLGAEKAEVDDTGDIPQYNRTLITRMLKVKFLEAAGFDTTKAQADLNQIFVLLTGNEKGAPVLNAGGRNGYPYLTNCNLPDTGFGGGI